MVDGAKPGPRERLLKAAARLFYVQGYHATGINQLIDEADVAKASFYQHFPSKQDLGAAYLRQVHEKWTVSLDQFLEHYSSERERILGLFDFLRAWKEEEGFRGCAFINIVVEIPGFDTEMQTLARRHYDAVRSRVRLMVDAYLSERSDEILPDDLTEGIVLLFKGAIVSSQTYEAVWPVERARAAVIGFIGVKTISNYVNHIAETQVDEQFSAVTEMPEYQEAVARSKSVPA